MNILFENQRVLLNQFAAIPFYNRDSFQKITPDNHITGIMGARGIGKTTLLLKLASDHGASEGRALYISADHIYFLEKNLLDLVEQLYKETEIRFLCIDEIHKAWRWQQVLKNISDIYLDFKIVFTSSSRIDLVRSQYDLSRRVTLHELGGLSFREYLAFFYQIFFEPQPLSTILNSNFDHQVSEQVPQVLRLFKEYLKRGYYPFSKKLTNDTDFYQALQQAAQKALYEDITSVHSLKTPTLMVLEKLYKYVLSITPGELSVNKLASVLRKDFNNVSDYLKMLEQSGLIRFLFSEQQGKAMLRNPIKIFPDNPNLIYSQLMESSDVAQLGMIRESFSLCHLQNAKVPVAYGIQGDFAAGEYVLEIGGKNKGTSQIDALEQGRVLKEGVLTGFGRVRPLYLLGFLY